MADAVVGEITKKVMEVLFKVIGRHIGYLVGYKRYVQNLEDADKRLKEVKQRIEGMVDEAKRNMEVIEGDVEGWLEEVQQKQKEVVELLEEKEKVRCLSMGLRYRLGRRGFKKKEDVNGLKQRGDDLVKRGSVGRPAPPTAMLDPYPDHYERFGSRETVFKDIMEALQDESKYIIGIRGMPGVGKTRMAVEVAKRAKEDGLFEEIANSTVSQTPDWEKIQQELADHLGLRLDKEASRAGRASRLCDRLKNGKKILVILDDVWDQFNLKKEIGIPFGEQMKGCKILLTSRKQDVCSRMRADKILEIGVIDQGEAWSLLKTKVGESVETAEMRWVAKEVCKECGGLPLAILAVGGALMDKGKPEWNDALLQLRNSRGSGIDGIEAQVYNPINLSYQSLEQADARSCFLHCSLFPEDAEISVDELVWYGVGRRFLRSFDKIEEARDRVHVLVGTLKRSSLLLQGQNETLVKMHDVIRDVAISIASKDEQYAFLVKNGVQGWPEKDKYECCIAISSIFNSTHKLPDELECPKLRTLVLAMALARLNVTPNTFFLKVPNNFFKGMEKLEVLDLTGLYIWTPMSLQNLRMLRLTSCKLVSLSLFNESHKLEILCLQDCIIEESPSPSTDIVELAIEVGKLTCLRILDFRRSKGIKVLPKGFILNLPWLEELYLYEFDGWKVEGKVSPFELHSLTSLSTLEIHIPDVTLFPKNLHFESLNRFKISIGSRIKFWEYDRSISRALKLKDIPLMVELNTLIERAQVLSFIVLNGLEKVLHDRDFPSLEYLNVSNCTVEYLFSASTAKGLRKLQKLTIENCERMEGIIGERDNEKAMDSIIFNQLKILTLENLPKLKGFCANMNEVSSTECSTSTCSTTQSLFNAKVLFPALETLWIDGLDNMTVLSKLLQQLQQLVVEDCESLETIIGEDEEEVKHHIIFHELKLLKLKQLPIVKSWDNRRKMSSHSTTALPLFDTKVLFPALKEWEIDGSIMFL